jgi:hypothetical protein
MFTTIWLGDFFIERKCLKALLLAEPLLFFYEKDLNMRNIYDCVESYIPLLNTEYEIILGRKGIA